MSKYANINVPFETVTFPSARKFSDFKTVSYNVVKSPLMQQPTFNYEELPTEVRTILETYPNVALAGGSIISNLYDQVLHDEQDYDLFICGGKNWETVRSIIKLFEGRLIEIGCGIVNINFDKPWNGPGSVQLIMAKYDSVEDVLNSFDLEQCKVAFSGGKFYMTELAEQAILHQVIPIERMFRFTTTRINKYINRGFGVATMRDTYINSINNLRILYNENRVIISSSMVAQEEDGDCEYSPYTASKVRDCVIREPELIPFIIFTSHAPYNPEINYGNITWREYLNYFCFDYENYDFETIYNKWHVQSLVNPNLKITYEYVKKVFVLFYESLDKKVNFWIDSFNNSDIPVIIN